MNVTTSPGTTLGPKSVVGSGAGASSPVGAPGAGPESLTLGELEQAINFWRRQLPSRADELRLCAPAAALAEPYAKLILSHEQAVPLVDLSQAARAALDGWRLGLEAEVPVQDR